MQVADSDANLKPSAAALRLVCSALVVDLSVGAEKRDTDSVTAVDTGDTTEISVVSMGGSPVAYILAGASTTVADVVTSLATQCNIPVHSIRILAGQRPLTTCQCVLPALEGLDHVLCMVHDIQPFEWGVHESSGAEVDGLRFSKIGNNPDYSTVLSKDIYSEGVHEFTFECLLEAKVANGTFIGIVAPGVDVALSIDQSSVPAIYYWSGGQVRERGLGSADLPPFRTAGTKVGVRLDCDNQRVYFFLNQNEEYNRDLPEGCGEWHFFICCDHPLDTWEVVQPE